MAFEDTMRSMRDFDLADLSLYGTFKIFQADLFEASVQ